MRGLELNIKFRDAAPDDANALAGLGRDTFSETFGREYAATDLSAFLDKTFNPERQAIEIVDPEMEVRVAESKRALVAYALLGPLKLPVDPGDRKALELHRIYVREERQGVGLGRILLSWTITRARERGADDLFLGVWADNARAIAVYESRGFEAIGRYDFHVGAQVDDEIIMRKRLTD
ncbi:MAG: GNAT family N-acetyltransferase [Pseudomonadota bacterium]